jgi:hypothetical protein
MKRTVRKTRRFVLATEVEVGVLRIADRPAAVVAAERLNGLALVRRYYEFCIVQGHESDFLSVTSQKLARRAGTDNHHFAAVMHGLVCRSRAQIQAAPARHQAALPRAAAST